MLDTNTPARRRRYHFDLLDAALLTAIATGGVLLAALLTSG